MSGHPSSSFFDYRLFGLAVRSDIELPELIASPAAALDIRITAGEIADGDESLVIDGVARFQVTGGTHIRVDAHPGAAPRNVRLYLLGSVIGMLLHQRGLLPLHASAVEIEGKAVAFMGPSGSGKSTIAAWFHEHGFRILTDDVCVIHFGGAGPLVVPGMPRMRLWKDVLEARGREPAALERSYAGADEWEKYDVPLADAAAGGELPLAGIYLLDQGDGLAISPIRGLATTEAVFANTYRGALVGEQGDAVGHWQACMALVALVPIARLQRAWDLRRLDQQMPGVLAHAKGLAGGDPAPQRNPSP